MKWHSRGGQQTQYHGDMKCVGECYTEHQDKMALDTWYQHLIPVCLSPQYH